jgi:hypothetical protein
MANVDPASSSIASSPGYRNSTAKADSHSKSSDSAFKSGNTGKIKFNKDVGTKKDNAFWIESLNNFDNEIPYFVLGSFLH